jgi:hypothetical protein
VTHSRLHTLLLRAMLALFAVAAVLLAACSGSTESPPADASGGAAATAPPSTVAPADALVEGTSFHATGNVPCSMGGGQPAGSCPFGVTREGEGGGMVTVTKPDGRARVIFFEKGKAIGCDASEADPGAFSASREGDSTIVLIGTERYEIPDAVIMGG